MIKKVIILGQGAIGKTLAQQCAIHSVVFSEKRAEVCEHITTRNPREYQENKCRFCGKPYKKQT